MTHEIGTEKMKTCHDCGKESTDGVSNGDGDFLCSGCHLERGPRHSLLPENEPAAAPTPMEEKLAGTPMTIDELEAVLASDEEYEIEILPSGEVRRAGGDEDRGGRRPLTYRENLGGEYSSASTKTASVDTVLCSQCGEFSVACPSCGSLEHGDCFVLEGDITMTPPPPPRFFGDDEMPLPACFELDKELTPKLQPIVDEWMARGYSSRDIYFQLVATAGRLTQMAFLCKRERAAKALAQETTEQP